MKSDNSTVQSRLSRFDVIRKYLRKFKNHIILGAIVIFISDALILISPYIIKSIFELLERGAASDELLPKVLLLLAIAVGSGILGFATKRIFLWMGRRIEYGLRRDLMNHVIRLSLSFYRKTQAFCKAGRRNDFPACSQSQK